MEKHILTIEEMINKLENKNIKFNIISKQKAIYYLEYNFNYYNLLTYTSNFQKYYINKKEVDKYIDLDFAYLIDLAYIDQKLRNILFNMLMQVEYYLKVWIYKTERNLQKDGKTIVNEYLKVDYSGEKQIHSNIYNKIGKVEYKEIMSKYTINKENRLENIPLWDFMNLITFGELVDFYDFYTLKNDLKKDHRIVYLLRDIVRLRNGVCHNDLLLSNLGEKDTIKTKKEISDYLDNIGIGKNLKENKLANRRVRQITSLLYIFNRIISSNEIKNKANNEINNLIIRIKKHKEYYTNNELLKSIYHFFLAIVKANKIVLNS